MFWQLFWTYLKIGTFTLGGGYAMIPLIQREVVDRRHWIEEEEFLNMIALAQAAPGIIAINSAIFVGYRIHGWRGMLATILGAVLPSFLIILAIAIVFRDFRDQPAVEAVFRGIRPAVVALIAAPLYKMARTALGKSPRPKHYMMLGIPVVVAILIWLCGVNPVYIILATIATTLCVTSWIRRTTK